MKHLLTAFWVWLACIASVEAYDFQFTNISAFASGGSTNTFLGVASGQVGFMCVGSNKLGAFTTLGYTNPVGQTGGYLVKPAGWTNYPVQSGRYFNAVAYGGGRYVASGYNNICFSFPESSPLPAAWLTNAAAQPGQPVDTEGIAYSTNNGVFSLVTGSYKAAYATTNLGWSNANVTAYAFLESFQAVTPFQHGSQFALCGLDGDIRISTNAGAFWNTNQIYNFAQPDLLGIGSDNANTIVAVGRSNVVMVSTSGGTNWGGTNWSFTKLTALSQPNYTNEFTSVVYSGTNDDRFFIFGTAGQAYYAYNTNNLASWTWIPLTNNISYVSANAGNTNLNAAAFASYGIYQGIMMMAGDKGTVIIGGTPPPAPTNILGLVTNVLGYPSQVLVVSNPFTDLHPAGTTTVDWYNSTNFILANLVQSGSDSNAGVTNAYTTTNQIICGIYTNYARARDIRTGFTSSNWATCVFYLIPPTPTNTFGFTNLLTSPNQTNALNYAQVFTNTANPFNYFQVEWTTSTNLTGSDILTYASLTASTNWFGYQPLNFLCGTYTNWAWTVAITTQPSGLTNLVSTNGTPVVFKIIPPPPTNVIPVALATNVMTANPQVINPLWVQVLINNGANGNPASSFEVDWYTNATGSNAASYLGRTQFIPGNTNWFSYTPTDSIYYKCGVYANWAETVATNTSPEGVEVHSTNRTQVTFVIVPHPPINAMGATNCAGSEDAQCGVPPISVQIFTNLNNAASNFEVNWYNTPTGGSILSGGANTLSYQPTDTEPGPHTYYAETMDISSGLVSISRTSVIYWILPRPLIPVTAFETVTNTISAPYQTNYNTLTVTESAASIQMITNYSPGANVVADWYTNNVDNAFSPVSPYLATGSTNIGDGPNGWAAHQNLAVGLNTNVFIPTNRISGYSVYYARARVINPNFSYCTCQSTNFLPMTNWILPAPPIAPVGWTNPLVLPVNTNAPLMVSVVTNADNPIGNFTVEWYADAGGTILLTNYSPLSGTNFWYVPTNATPGVYTNWARTMTTNTSPAGLTVVSSNLTQVVFSLYPTAPMLTVGSTSLLTLSPQNNATNYAEVFTNTGNPFNNFQVEWTSGTNLTGTDTLATTSLTTSYNWFGYQPLNALAGTYTNWAWTIAVATTPPGLTNLISTNGTPVVFQIIPPAPTNAIAVANATNVMTASPQVLNSLWVQLLINSSNPASSFEVDWYTNATGSNAASYLGRTQSSPGNTNWFFYIPTNSIYYICGVYTNWAETVATNTSPEGVEVHSTNRTAVTFVITPAAPIAPVGWANPLIFPVNSNASLSVSVLTNPNNPFSSFAVDWYADPNGVSLLQSNSTFSGTNYYYTPTNATAGIFTNWARTRALVTLPSGLTLVSSNLTPVTFSLNPGAPVGTASTNNCAYGGTNGIFSCANPWLTVTNITSSSYQINWYAASNSVSPLPGGANTNSYQPTNTLQGIYTYWYAATDTVSMLTSVRTNVTFLVLPVPLAPLATNATNCATMPNGTPLMAYATGTNTVLTNTFVEWYADSNGINLLAKGTNYYAPTISMTNLDNNHASNYVFWARTYVPEEPTNYCECHSTNLVAVTNSVVPVPTATVIANANWTNIYYQTNYSYTTNYVITFDDINSGIASTGVPIASGYDGFGWVNFNAFDTYPTYGNVSGYYYGTISLTNCAGQNPAIAATNTASITNSTPFTLVSAYATAAWDKNLQLNVVGYTNGTLLYSNTYVLSSTAATNIVFNYSNVTEVDFSPTGGTQNPNYSGTGQYYALDNVAVSQPFVTTNLLIATNIAQIITNYYPTELVCNGDQPTLTNVLTGVGPWTVVWINEETGITCTNSYTNMVTGTGPFTIGQSTAEFNLMNTLPNQESNCVFSIISVSTPFSCSGTVAGSTMVTIEPSVGSQIITTNIVSAVPGVPCVTNIYATLSGVGPFTVAWADGYVQSTNGNVLMRAVTNIIKAPISTNYWYVFQRLRSVGNTNTTTPLTSTDDSGIPPIYPLYYTNNTLTNATLVVSPNVNINAHAGVYQLFSTNVMDGTGNSIRYWNYFTTNTFTTLVTNPVVTITNYYYSIASVSGSLCSASPSNISGQAEVTLVPGTSVVVSGNQTTVCPGGSVIITATFNGTPPWTAYWADGTTNLVQSTNNPLILTNYPVLGTNIYAITNLVDGSNNVSTNIFGSVTVVVYPLPTNAPQYSGLGTNYVCIGSPNPTFTVIDTNIVCWFDDNNTMVASNTISFTPLDTDYGTYTYYAAEVNPSGCAGPVLTYTMVIEDCSLQSPSLVGNTGSISWIGLLVLQGTTNLAPANWQDLYIPATNGINLFNFTNGVAPWTNQDYFFRLNTN